MNTACLLMFTSLQREHPLIFLSTKFKHRPMCCLCLPSLDTWSGTPEPVQSIGTVQQLSRIMSLRSLECARFWWKSWVAFISLHIYDIFMCIISKCISKCVCDSCGPYQQNCFRCCSFFSPFLFMSCFNAFLSKAILNCPCVWMVLYK